MNPRRNSTITFKLLLAVGLILGSFGTKLAQEARPSRGQIPTGSFAVSDIESVSLTNGNVNIGIPLASLPPIAGGKLGLTLRAEYNSKPWDAVKTEVQPDPLDPANKYVRSDLQMSDAGGWRISGGYYINFESVSSNYDFLPPSVNDPDYTLITGNSWVKVTLTMPDGSKHELRPIDYSSYYNYSQNHTYLRGYYKDTPHTVNASVRYYSFDGSRIWAKIDNSQYCCYGSAASWTLYLPDGTKVEQLSNGDQRITDTNGNKVKTYVTQSAGIFTSHFQDEQTTREIKSVYDPSGNGGLGSLQVQYQTVGGTWQTITINLGQTHVFGKRYEFGDPNCTEAASYVDSYLTVIRSIVYPQTEPGQAPRQFSFTYNSDTTDSVNFQWRTDCGSGYQTITSASHGWGSLSHITLPTGAIVNYGYGLDGHHYLTSNPDDAPREVINAKTLTHDGTSDSWSYSITPGTGGFTAPDGSSVTEWRYPSDTGYAHSNSGFGGKEELVYRSNSSNKTLIERHWTLMRFSGGDDTAAGSLVQVAFNPVVDAEYTSLLDDTPQHNPVKMSAKTYEYDYNGNLLTETVYDWFDPAVVSRDAQGVPIATSIPASAQLRIINNTYYNQATAWNSGNIYSKRALSNPIPLILNAPQQSTLGSSITQLSYDGQTYGSAPTIGNLTSKRVWDDLDNKWITTSNTFDSYGNLQTSTDGRQKVTQYSFADATHALPTSVTVDPQNNTGTQTVSTVYDYFTGLVTSQTDVNNQTSTIDYTNLLLNSPDPFGRPAITYRSQVTVNGVNQRRRVTTTYRDSQLKTIVATDLNAENDQILKVQTTTDMLGRVVKTEQTEGGASYDIYSLRAYDQMGKITYSSGPMRVNTPSNTDSWTRITHDDAGRVTEVATFAGSAQPQPTGTPGLFTGRVTSVYDGPYTTVTDQALKVRRSMIDGLGRLRRVDEPDANVQLGHSNSPNQPTCYQYDSLGNLTKVIQGTLLDPTTGVCSLPNSQQRTFVYDSLSRLRSANNPESGTVVYTYDDNGNLLTRTDARQPSVVTTYVYDSLNRPTTRSYSDGTPTVSYTYDAATVSNSKGRLTSVSSSVSSYNFTGFNALGAALGANQTLGSQTYTMTYTYDLAGHVKSMTYPSGRFVNYSYDNTGRTSSVNGNLGDNATRTYSTDINYDTGSRITQEKFGTNVPIYNKLYYNSRGQLAEIREGLTPNNTNWERGAIINFYSTCWGMCSGSSMPSNNGNLLRQEYWIQNDAGQVVAIPTQEFEYDSLNRIAFAKEGTSWKQQYNYDKFGNRRIDQNNTFGAGIPKPDFGLNTSKNQLTAPSGYAMSYDDAGNLTNDTYSGAGQRTFDGENRMKQAWANSQWQSYSYNGDGRRVKRTVNGVETWQVYGLGGELLAEYTANGTPATPQKEYGYRNGQLLITGSVTPTQQATENVTWTSAVNVSVNGNSLTKSAATSAFDAAAYSTKAIASGDGYVEMTITETNKDRFFGLSDGETTVDNSDIDFSMRPYSNGVVYCYEPGTNGAFCGYYSSGNKLRLGIESGVVKYYLINGGTSTLVYTASHAPAYPLVADASIYDNGGTVSSVVISGNLMTRGGINWLVTDQIGTPRMVFDQTGNMANVSRHDYLPFGEELLSGGRAAVPGYSGGDSVRQQFTSKERDAETSLDYFGERYYGSQAGRFTTPDTYMPSAKTGNPQTWNRYAYVLNNPLRYIDPDGLDEIDPWNRLTKDEKNIVAAKLLHAKVKGKDGKIHQQTDQEAFDSLIGSGSEEQIANKVAAIKNLIDNAGGHEDSSVWRGIDIIREVSLRENNSVTIRVEVDLRGFDGRGTGFLSILQNSGKYDVDRYYENANVTNDHTHSARYRTAYSSIPGMHFTQEPHFAPYEWDVHWDPQSSAFENYNPVGLILNAPATILTEQIGAGLSHGSPLSAVQVREQLKRTGIVPKGEN